MNQPLRCVIDANVGIKRFINDPLTLKVRQLFDTLDNSQTAIYIPDLFYIETANIFCKYVRAGFYTNQEVQADLATLKAFPLIVTSSTELIKEAVNIALTPGISAYDAAYVTLSHQVNTPLLTLDRKLFNALVNSSYNVCYFADFPLP